MPANIDSSYVAQNQPSCYFQMFSIVLIVLKERKVRRQGGRERQRKGANFIGLVCGQK